MVRTILAGFLFLLSSVSAQAQPQCGPHDEVLAGLERQYGETVIARGIDGNSNMVEVVWSPVARSWTILVTTPDMISCVAGAGLYMELHKPLPPGTGA
ncbi:MAG TPA: hypothetical protein VEA44_14720 [Caulobacter sp.]|nr:hypothetical protein [Caulobacter sp.]